MNKKIISLFCRAFTQINKDKYEQTNQEMDKGYERQLTEKQIQIVNNVRKDVQLSSN